MLTRSKWPARNGSASALACTSGLDLDEATRLHDLDDLLDRHTLGNRLPVVLHQQLGVPVPGSDPHDQGEHSPQVELEQRPSDEGARPRDFQDQQAPAWLQEISRPRSLIARSL